MLLDIDWLKRLLMHTQKKGIKNMQETYICSYRRTPIGGFQGSLSKIPATKLGSIVIESILDNTLVPKDKINELIVNYYLNRI